MPSVGPTEALLLLVIALLVLGPTKLPELGRQLGRGIRQFREAARNVTKEMGAEDLVEDLKELNQARGTFGQTVRKELGLDELGPFPDLDEVGKDKPAAPAESPAVPAAAAAEVPVAATPVVPATAETAADAPVAATAAEATAVEASPEFTAPPADPPAPRKRTRRAAAVASPAEEAAPTPRKRTAKAAATAPADESAAAAPAPRKRTARAAAVTTPQDDAVAPPTPRPARKRTPRVKPSETV
jgi:TatA/E family protein of Tat protein translocase